MTNARYRVRAHAKINLGLKIVGRRADGYHELRTVFQTISLADRVEVEIAPRRRGMTEGITDAITLETTGLAAPAGADNLAYRAAALGAAAFGVRGGIHIRVHKRIPLGAGLGGGSADAAAVLRALAQAAPQPPEWRTKLDTAAQLGSDVPALMLGGTVLGLGRGEEVYPLPDIGPWPGLVVLPAPGAAQVPAIATAEAFARWDTGHAAHGGSAPSHDTIMEFCSLLWQVLPAFSPSGANRGRVIRPRVHAGIENDFQSGVFSLSPDFPRIHQQLSRRQAFWVSLTGSGAAQYGLFREASGAQAAAAGFSRDRVWAVRCVGRRAFERGLVRMTG